MELIPTQPNEEFIRNTWIPALRSGEYKQVKGALHTTDGYCCLGVACTLIPALPREARCYREEPQYEQVQRVPDEMVDEFLNDPRDWRFVVEYSGNEGTLPNKASQVLGISHEGLFDPCMEWEVDGVKRSAGALVALNDGGWTFEQIADFIENEILNPLSEYQFVDNDYS